MFTLDQLQLLPPNKWEDLENLVKELFRAEWGDFHAQRHGRQGQAQQGVDVFGRPASIPGWAGVQCKNKDLLIRARLTVRELRDEVRKAKSFQPALGQFIIATTAPRDARLQQEARNISERQRRRGGFSVHVYAWDDIVELLTKHERVATRYYGNVLGALPEGRQPLLGEETMAAAFAAGTAKPAKGAPGPTAPLILSAPATRALGMLATNPLPLPEEAYRRLFPDIDWKALIPTLVAAQAVESDPAGLRVPDSIKERFLPSPDDCRPYVDAWITALEPLRGHVDMAVFLSLQYLARQEHGLAVDVLVDIAADLERGWWNDLYASLLQPFSQSGILKRVSGEQRRRFSRAYGLCLARGRTPGDALRWASRLRKDSVRAGDHLGVAQAMLLVGIARQNQGDGEKAAGDYRQVITFARRHRLTWLVGHALHNLAMLTLASDPLAAARLLEDSIRVKKEAGDEPGRVAALFGRGSVAVGLDRPAEAFRWFSRAEKLANQMDMDHLRALALCNMATALVDQDRPREAVPLYKTAQTLAENEGYPDALALATGGEAGACLALNRLARAHDCFLRLHRVRHDLGDMEAAVVARHDAGVCLLKQGKAEAARQVLTEALGEARQHGVWEWVYRCLKDIALTYADEGDPDRTVALLRQAAEEEERSVHFGVAAKLWESVATVLADRSADGALVEDAFLRAVTALEHEEGSVDERIRLLSGLHVCRWSCGAYDRALDALRAIERLARENRRRESLARALDQRGTCLQQLGRTAEAIADHRKALAVARTLPDTFLVEACLHNLGEALRKTDKTAAAIEAFREAEAIASARDDHASAIMTAHNRALALADSGQRAQARRVLERCLGDARRLALWDEAVRASHALANHAWLSGKRSEALLRYRDVLAEAKKHQVDDQLGPISLNYANALHHTNRPRQALRVLQAAEGGFLSGPDAHEYLAHLGEIAAEASEHAVAKDAYVRARRYAIAVGAVPEAAAASIALSDLFVQEEDYARADEVLKDALTGEPPPEQQAALLTRRLGVLLKSGKAQQAGKVFARLQSLTKQAGLHEEAVDVHMLLGDHEWDRGKSHIEALKAYTAALMPAAELGVDVMVRTGMHTIQRLLSIDSEQRLGEIDRIERALVAWLKQEVGAKRLADAVTVALWPLRVARRVTPSARAGPNVSARRMTEIIREEIFGHGTQPRKK
jgi:tetratricopeptide (TPR) repeat protein